MVLLRSGRVSDIGAYIVGHYPTQLFLYIINPPKNVIQWLRSRSPGELYSELCWELCVELIRKLCVKLRGNLRLSFLSKIRRELIRKPG